MMKKVNKLMIGSFLFGFLFLFLFGFSFYENKQTEKESVEFIKQFMEHEQINKASVDDIKQFTNHANDDNDETGNMMVDVHESESIVETRETLPKNETIHFEGGYYNPFLKEQFSAEYGENLGVLEIPKIDAQLPIVEGTDQESLAKGVGHFQTSSFPLDDNQIVLSGHRDTVFRRMGELELGDVITVKLAYGSFDYEVINTKIVDEDDRTIIVPHDEEILTVTTCYPFYYVGNAPDRYIVYAKPVWKSELEVIK